MKNYFEIMEIFTEAGIDTEICSKLAWNVKGCTACIATLVMLIGVLLIVLLIIKSTIVCEEKRVNDGVWMFATIMIVILITILLSCGVVLLLDWAQTEMINWVIEHKVG